MNRFNSFTTIHKGLRAMLYDAALTLQQTCFQHADEASTAMLKVENVLFLFEKHAAHEDAFILPAIEKFEPGLVESFEQEHVTDLALAEKLKHLLIIFRNTETSEEKIICGSVISKSFTEFMVFNLEHMAKEEILINQALWKHYTDQQLISLVQVMVSSIPENEKGLGSKWMIRGINNDEAVNWLKSVKQTVPVFAFEALMALAEAELPAERFEKIQDGLLEASFAVY